MEKKHEKMKKKTWKNGREPLTPVRNCGGYGKIQLHSKLSQGRFHALRKLHGFRPKQLSMWNCMVETSRGVQNLHRNGLPHPVLVWADKCKGINIVELDVKFSDQIQRKGKALLWTVKWENELCLGQAAPTGTMMRSFPTMHTSLRMRMIVLRLAVTWLQWLGPRWEEFCAWATDDEENDEPNGMTVSEPHHFGGEDDDVVDGGDEYCGEILNIEPSGISWSWKSRSEALRDRARRVRNLVWNRTQWTLFS